MMDKLVIYGDGSMAKTVFPYLSQKYDVTCFTVESNYKTHSSLFGLPVINFEDLQNNGEKFAIAIGFHKLNEIREKYFNTMIDKGFTPISFIDSGLERTNKLTLGKGSLILEKASIHYNTRIGSNVFISTGVNIGHDCIIEDNVWINSGVTIAGNTKIGNNSVLGINATIGNDIIIGRNNFIGAATLVTNNTEDDTCFAIQASKPLSVTAKAFMAITRKIS